MSPTSVSLGSSGPRAHIDRDGNVSDWDPAFENLWGRSASQAVGRKLDQLLVALEPAALPDLASIPSDSVWSGIVALVPTNGNAPRTTGIRLTRTDSNGRFEYKKLIARGGSWAEHGGSGEYAMSIAHPDFCAAPPSRRR